MIEGQLRDQGKPHYEQKQINVIDEVKGKGNFCTFGNDLNFMLEIEHCCWDQLNAVIVKVDQFKTIQSVNNFEGMAI